MNIISIETTYPNLKEAKDLSKALLDKSLASCVQFTNIESSYIWKGEVENSKEILVTIKTKKELFEEIEKIIKNHHQYDTVQIISKNIDNASSDYFDWIKSSLKG